MPVVYIGHAANQYAGDAAALVELCVREPDGHGGWVIKATIYERNSSLNVREFCSVVRQTPGPVLLIRPVQNKTVELVREKLDGFVPVVVCEAYEIDGLRASIADVCRRHQGGEPHEALDVVVAFLLMRKLDQEHMWTGNSKGYMWSSDIPKGRGVDDKYSGRVPHVLNTLFQEEIVVCKISNSKKKYALNPDKRELIYGYLRKRRLPDSLHRKLSRSNDVESVRVLDCLDIYTGVDEDEGGER
ncbi:hypothetical protein [Pandoraea bronchicola]|uniref:Uncharacterized protein n=1 Tax=Pandoraea bronchicola TaxID=2508287 RepID=A0A5E5BYQ5_9BURK|nr:hypothetical protein [Pandoraea bronchicola]VVE89470.1 hypothetical protein PBR20603_03442 [Pandoraea bronchicola]